MIPSLHFEMLVSLSSLSAMMKESIKNVEINIRNKRLWPTTAVNTKCLKEAIKYYLKGGGTAHYNAVKYCISLWDDIYCHFSPINYRVCICSAGTG